MGGEGGGGVLLSAGLQLRPGGTGGEGGLLLPLGTIEKTGGGRGCPFQALLCQLRRFQCCSSPPRDERESIDCLEEKNGCFVAVFAQTRAANGEKDK